MRTAGYQKSRFSVNSLYEGCFFLNLTSNNVYEKSLPIFNQFPHKQDKNSQNNLKINFSATQYETNSDKKITGKFAT